MSLNDRVCFLLRAMVNPYPWCLYENEIDVSVTYYLTHLFLFYRDI